MSTAASLLADDGTAPITHADLRGHAQNPTARYFTMCRDAAGDVRSSGDVIGHIVDSLDSMPSVLAADIAVELALNPAVDADVLDRVAQSPFPVARNLIARRPDAHPHTLQHIHSTTVVATPQPDQSIDLDL